jgi:predicted nucleic acid-binding protein
LLYPRLFPFNDNRQPDRLLESWKVVALTADIAANAARLRASLRLKLADAVQAASAISINADAIVTHDRDFSRVRTLRVMSIEVPKRARRAAGFLAAGNRANMKPILF